MKRITSHSFSKKSVVKGEFAIAIPAGKGAMASVVKAYRLTAHLGLVSVQTKDQGLVLDEVWLVSDDKLGTRVQLEPVERNSRGDVVNEAPIYIFGKKKKVQPEPEATKPEPPKKQAKEPEPPKKRKAKRRPKPEVTEPDDPTLLSEEAQRILDAMDKGVKYSKQRIAVVLDIGTSEWNKGINELLDAKLVVKTGKKRGTKYELA